MKREELQVKSSRDPEKAPVGISAGQTMAAEGQDRAAPSAGAFPRKEAPPSHPPAEKSFPIGRVDTRVPSLPDSVSGGAPRQVGGLTFNFDNADIYDVIRVMAEVLGINYIVDPGISGKVTIQTSGGLKKRDLYTVFHQILEINGLAAVKEGGLVRIIKSKDASRMTGLSLLGGGSLIQVVSLDYIAGDELTKLLTPFISADGLIVAGKGTNTLIIVDRIANIQKILDLVKVFDVDLFEDVNYKFYKLSNTEVKDASQLLEQIMSAEGAKDIYQFVPMERINTILAVCRRPRRFDHIDKLIMKLDEINNLSDPQIYVYHVKNGEAGELADLLRSVFDASQSDKNENALLKQKESGEAKEKNKLFSEKGVKKTGQEKNFSEDFTASGSLAGEVKITPDKIRNALIIEALPSDYRVVTRILEQVDILPRQVLIEVIIAEINLDDSMTLGVDWTFDSSENTSALMGKGEFKGTLTGEGLGLTMGLSDKIDAKLTALAANKKVNIISTPRILASDNKEAKINISDRIPVASTTYNSTENSNVIETSIQYVDTGVILSVTPHINDRGLVSMEISQEVSNSSDSVNVGGKQYPSFNSRNVETSLTVSDGQTIVIGGLMEETKEKDKKGLPFFSNLPIIGFLFGSDGDSDKKRELILLITPSVIRDLDAVDELSREFKTRVGEMKKILGVR